jgi:hypothetical protein
MNAILQDLTPSLCDPKSLSGLQFNTTVLALLIKIGASLF